MPVRIADIEIAAAVFLVFDGAVERDSATGEFGRKCIDVVNTDI
jgi:hypothetical protein